MSYSLNDLIIRSNPVGDILAEVDANDRPIYMGFSLAGSETSASAWKIIKFTYTGDNSTPDSIKTANGSDDQNKVWDKRATDYTY